jgi:threonine synthase
MGLIKIVNKIYQVRGYHGFYAGFRINLFRILPNTAIMFTAYENLSKHLEELAISKGLI